MAKSSAFLVKAALQALALLVLVVAAWATPQQAFAATGYLDPAAALQSPVLQALALQTPALQTPPSQLRSWNHRALDWPRADPCALTRKLPSPRAETRRQNGAAHAQSDASAAAHGVLAAAGSADSEPGAAWQAATADRRIEAPSRAAFQSRAPPPPIRW